MTKVIECPSCDVVVRAETDEELIEIVKTHAKKIHNMEFTDEQVLSMARPA